MKLSVTTILAPIPVGGSIAKKPIHTEEKRPEPNLGFGSNHTFYLGNL
ncbi:MAG: hypothetical protein ACJASJ_001056 [Candidatus Azotimanducaceae bacterium]|jgi:hypothetical protein